MKLLFVSALALALSLVPLRAHDASAEMAVAANHFLLSLTAEQKAKTTFEFSGKDRTDWHFVPRARKGLAIKEMTQEQRLLAQALLATGLSHRGYVKAVSIMSLESILAEMENDRQGNTRDPEKYYVSIFGTPGGAEPWGWRVEGHHLALNFTAAGDAAPSMTPSFFGSNPGEIRKGPRTGTRTLAEEEDLGRAVVKALTDEQRKQAIILAEAPKDILAMPGRNEPLKPQGITQDKLTPEQNALLIKLIKEYLFRCRPDVAAEELAKIEKAGPAKLYFAWAGGVERGQPHYYRVQGDSFLLEYDNTQNQANHVHSLWRDFSHDFGADLLGEHYKTSHTTPAPAP